MDNNESTYPELKEKAKALGIKYVGVSAEDLAKDVAEAEANGVNPKDPAVESTESKPKKEKKAKVVEDENADVTFETTEKVEFILAGKVFSGTEFTFPANVVEDRKRLLRDAYGKEIIK